jgi:tetratricopeptide (TPR) repeat protein
MKKATFFLLYFIWTFTTKAQDELRFHVTQNTAEGAGIKGVSVRVDSIGNATTDDNGIAKYPNLKSSHRKVTGEKVRIDAFLNGYKPVNSFDLVSYKLGKNRSDSVHIFLAKNSEHKEVILKYFQKITNISLSRDFEKKELELEKQIKNWSDKYKKLNENALEESKQLWIRIDSLNSQLEVLAQQKEKQQTQADLIANILASVSENIEDPMLPEAFLLFKEGKFEEAQKVLDEKTIDKEKIEYEKEEKLSEILKASSARKKENYISKCLLKAQLFELTNQNSEVISWYEKAYQADSTKFNTLFSYAEFLQKINYPTKSSQLYEKALLFSKDLDDKAKILNNLGVFYQENQEKQKAEVSYLEALKYRRQLSQKNEAKYLLDLANTLNNLGNFYRDNQEKQKAEVSFLEALKYYRQLSQKNEAQYLPYLAITLNNLGVFYKDNQEKQKAEDSYLEALKYRRQLSQKYESQYLPDLASTLNNLGVFYSENQEKQKAEVSFLEALKYYRQLSQKNEAQYLPYLANTLNNLGVFYKDNQEKQKAEDSHLEALKYRRQLSQKNESQYLPDLASTLNNLGSFYKDNQEKQKAEDSYLEALKYRRQLSQKKESQYLPYLANTLNNLGFFYQYNQEKQKAEVSYLEALKYFRQLSQKNEAQYLPDLAQTQIDIGVFYITGVKQLVFGEGLLIEGLQNYQKLAIRFSNPIFWQKGVKIINFLPNLRDFDSIYTNKLKIQKSIINFYEVYPVKSDSTLSSAYGSGAWYALMAKEFKQAEDFAQKGLSKDPTQTWIFSNLAPALLLQNRWEEAKKIYVEKQNLPRGDKTMREVFLADLADLEKEGITNPYFEKVRALLKK